MMKSNEEANLPHPNSKDPLARWRTKLPSKDARGHPDGLILPAVVTSHLLETNKEQNEVSNKNITSSANSQQEAKEGEDIKLVLDVLIGRGEGMGREGEDPGHFITSSEM